MSVETAKVAVKALTEQAQIKKDVTKALAGTKQQAIAAQKLWKCKNQSFLIKAGMALVVFPEPLVSDMLGTSLIAAGAIQQGIKRQSIYLDDLPKALKSAMRDIRAAKELF